VGDIGGEKAGREYDCTLGVVENKLEDRWGREGETS
jgi:hypothetical protein